MNSNSEVAVAIRRALAMGAAATTGPGRRARLRTHRTKTNQPTQPSKQLLLPDHASAASIARRQAPCSCWTRPRFKHPV